MKLRYLLALPIVATALAGCDDIEYSDAKPVENPQLPGITVSDFSVTPSASLTGTMDLDALNELASDPNSYEVELFTINTLTADLPEGAVVSGSLQLAAQDDPEFSNPYDVPVTTVDGVASTTLYDLDYTRSTMYGKDPRPYDVYYRISVYVTVDGGQYKIGAKDYYFCDGDDFIQEGVDPGYYVEEAYYLLGPNGTEIGDAVIFEHSEYNIYDDTIFTVTAVFEGGDNWLVVPLSAYDAAIASGTLDKSACYGPASATEAEGELVLGGNAGTVEQGMKYQIQINLSTLTYTVEQKPLLEVGDPTDIYLRGGMNDWGYPAHYEFLATDNQQVSVMPYVVIAAGVEFKVADADWSSINYGSNGGILTPGEEYELVYNAGNLMLEKDFVGSVILSKSDEGNYSLLLLPFEATTEGESSGIFVRGGMNDWGAPEEDEFLTSEYKNVWCLSNITIETGTEFKVADADWAEINLGANASAGDFDETTGTGVLGLVNSGANITLAANFTGDLRLVTVNNCWYLFFLLESED